MNNESLTQPNKVLTWVDILKKCDEWYMNVKNEVEYIDVIRDNEYFEPGEFLIIIN